MVELLCLTRSLFPVLGTDSKSAQVFKFQLSTMSDLTKELLRHPGCSFLLLSSIGVHDPNTISREQCLIHCLGAEMGTSVYNACLVAFIFTRRQPHDNG